MTEEGRKPEEGEKKDSYTDGPAEKANEAEAAGGPDGAEDHTPGDEDEPDRFPPEQEAVCLLFLSSSYCETGTGFY